jgi:hypothetical protein
MSYQEVFNKAVTGLIEQGQKSSKEYPNLESICFYRKESDGKIIKCAIGHVLSDEQITKYNIKEGSNPYSFPEELVAELLSINFSDHPNNGLELLNGRGFLAGLQAAHDGAKASDFEKSFMDAAKKLALTYELEMPK